LKPAALRVPDESVIFAAAFGKPYLNVLAGIFFWICEIGYLFLTQTC
jgi:hypothetical protein